MTRRMIVDIDGTVALHVRPDGTLLRGHHAYDLVASDLPNEPVIALVKAMEAHGWEPIFVSGRPERARQDTYAWFQRWFGYRPFLFMREDGDHRADDVVKREIWDAMFTQSVKDSIKLVLDDRPRVIRMWAELGLTVIDVNPLSGEF